MIRLEPNPPKRQMTGSPETETFILCIQNCQSCHTAELTGQPSSFPSLVDFVSRISAARVKSTILSRGKSKVHLLGLRSAATILLSLD
jgi:quinoprotein glucose dehydrogenase